MNERKNELILKSELYYYDLSYLLETLGAKSGLELRTPDTQPSDLGSKEEVESEQKLDG